MLDVKNLSVRFDTPDGDVCAVTDLSFSMSKGETLAIVGESGSGKSQTAFAILGLLDRNGHATGSVRFDGQEVLNLPEQEMNAVRSRRISMIFQDPMTSLNPYIRVSDQLSEVLMLHDGKSKADARKEALHMLDAVRIPDAARRIDNYPHEFSGGMRQRIMIAMALMCRPELLIADEPTTALDVTVQAQIMALLSDIQQDFGMGIILITHDLGIVAGSCARTLVLYGGRVMEEGPTDQLFKAPKHPYTTGLLQAVPRFDRDDEALLTIPGDPPDMSNPPPGCPFAPRCPLTADNCQTMPPLTQDGGRRHACHQTEMVIA